MDITNNIHQRQMGRIGIPVVEIYPWRDVILLKVQQIRCLIGQQAKAVDHKDAIARFLLGQSVINHQRNDFFRNPASGRAATEKHHALVADPRTGGSGGSDQRA